MNVLDTNDTSGTSDLERDCAESKNEDGILLLSTYFYLIFLFLNQNFIESTNNSTQTSDEDAHSVSVKALSKLEARY